MESIVKFGTIFDAIAATATKALAQTGDLGESYRARSIFLEINGGSTPNWTLAIQGKVSPDATYHNIDFMRVDQGTDHTITATTLTVNWSTAQHYVIPNPPPFVQLVATRTGGSLTVYGAFSSEAYSDAFPTVNLGAVVPGTGATNLGKAEDDAHASGDTGVAVWAVQKATPADLAADGDYAALEVSGGKLWVHDNAIVGATSDAAVSTDATGTMHQYLRGLVVLFVNFLTRLPAALGAGGGLKVDGSGTALPVTGTITAVTAVTAITNALPAGTNLLGKVGIDQTTPGTTNSVDPIANVAARTKAFGEVAGNASATVFPTLACKWVKIKAEYNNAGRVYIGVAGVTKQDGSSDTTTGYELSAGEDTGWIPVANMNELYRICDNAGDDVTYMALV